MRRADLAQADLAPSAVTGREREVIQVVAQGRSNKEAAAKLGISVKTIEAHRANIMRKLHLRSVSDRSSNLFTPARIKVTLDE